MKDILFTKKLNKLIKKYLKNKRSELWLMKKIRKQIEKQEKLSKKNKKLYGKKRNRGFL